LKLVLSHYSFESPIEFKEDIVNYLVLENQRNFTDHLFEIYCQIKDEEGGFILSKNDENIEFFKNVELIVDPFSLNLNNKKMIGNLLAKMKDDAFGERHYLKTEGMLSTVYSTILSIARDQNFSVTMNEGVDIMGLFKLLDVRLEYTSDKLVDKICEYISICSEYSQTILFIFVNLRSFFTNDELKDFYKFLFYNKIHVLMIESRLSDISENEKAKIIDEDLCEVTLTGKNPTQSTKFEV